MKRIETVATISPDGTLTAHVPPDVPVGEHRIVLVIDEVELTVRRGQAAPRPDFPVRDYGPWPAGLSLRREDMYGDDGR